MVYNKIVISRNVPSYLKKLQSSLCIFSIWLSLSSYIPIAMVLPLYIDELFYKLSSEHFAINGLSNNMMPQCGPSWIHVPPLLVQPCIWLSRFLGGGLSTLWQTRLIGVFLWYFTLTVFGISLTFWEKVRTPSNLILLFAAQLTGVLPLAGAMRRPENLFLFLFSLWFLVWTIIVSPFSPLMASKKSILFGDVFGLEKLTLLKGLLFFLGLLTITSIHRGLVFSPFIGILTIYAVFKRRGYVLGVICFALVTWQDYMWALQYSECPLDGPTKAFSMLAIVDPSLLRHQPGLFFQDVIKILINVGHYWSQMMFPMAYSLRWLPDSFGNSESFNRIGCFAFNSMMYGGLLGVLSILFKRNYKVFFGCLLFVLSMVSYILLDKRLAWYRAPSVSMGIMVLVIYILIHFQDRWLRNLLGIGFCVLTLWSSRILFRSSIPYLDIWKGVSPIVDYSLTTYNQWNYEIFRERYFKDANQCLKRQKDHNIFIVDGYTYPLLAQNADFNPVVFWNIVHPSNGTKERIRDILIQSRIFGGYALCENEMDRYFSRSSVHDSFCCYTRL